jgi:hypothetical protein
VFLQGELSDFRALRDLLKAKLNHFKGAIGAPREGLIRIPGVIALPSPLPTRYLAVTLLPSSRLSQGHRQLPPMGHGACYRIWLDRAGQNPRARDSGAVTLPNHINYRVVRWSTLFS